jgi:mannose-6-phosphate isomerase-like protein (cupin superfamily)
MSDSKLFTEKRPWGEFRQYAKNEPVTVKTIYVKNGESLSLQYHKQRSEFWRILKGEPEVTIGEEKIKAKAGDEFTVPLGAKHRVAAPFGDVEFLEISRGNFDESDNIRIEDKYGRA